MDKIAIPVKDAWVFAEYEPQPPQLAMNQLNEWLHAQIVFYRLFRQAGDERPFEDVRMRVGLDCLSAECPRDRVVRAFAPHVLVEYLVARGSVVLAQEGEIDLDAWIRDRAPKSISCRDLEEALDGGRAAYRAVCRRDVLRILLECYEAEGVAGGRPEAAIIQSPLRTRFFDESLVRGVIADLQAERLVTGSAEQWRLDPAQVQTVRAEVENTTGRPDGASPVTTPGGVFARGQGYPAWEQLRGVVKSARRSLWLEDPYLNSDVVALLAENVGDGVSVRVLGPQKPNSHWSGALASLKRLAPGMPGRIEVRLSAETHDRYVYTDDRVWQCGGSFKDMATRAPTTITEHTPQRSRELCKEFETRWAAAQPVSL